MCFRNVMQIYMIRQILFSGKSQKNITNFSSAEFAQSMVSVNIYADSEDLDQACVHAV